MASPEVRFKIDSESHDPTDVALYEHKDANALVEEFMLLANKLVAEKLLKAAPAHCLLRAHPPPRTSKLLDWCRLAYECGFKPPVRACRTSAQTDMQLLAGTK